MRRGNSASGLESRATASLVLSYKASNEQKRPLRSVLKRPMNFAWRGIQCQS
jgi:hypothetical protein